MTSIQFSRSRATMGVLLNAVLKSFSKRAVRPADGDPRVQLWWDYKIGVAFSKDRTAINDHFLQE
jgi:hypothetical protein